MIGWFLSVGAVTFLALTVAAYKARWFCRHEWERGAYNPSYEVCAHCGTDRVVAAEPEEAEDG